VFVKPANLGSSVGISRVRSPAALAPAVREAFLYDEKVLVEEGVPGARELECAVLGDLEPEPSVVGEIEVDHPDGFYSYDAKYVDEKGATLRIPAELSPDQVRAIQLLAIRTFRVLEASGLARVDFFLSRETGELYVNEINSIPGFTSISMYPKLWEASGVPARALVGRLVELALARAARRRSLRVSK
jgi:D-alanine-D-alanine ligase